MSNGHSLTVTTVINEVLIEGCDVLATLTDGSTVHWKLNAPPKLPDRVISRLTWVTREQGAAVIHEINADQRMRAFDIDRAAKVQRLGWDYRQRGYH